MAVVPRLAQLLRLVVVAVAQLGVVVDNPGLLAVVVVAERMPLELVARVILHQLPHPKEIMGVMVAPNLVRTELVAVAVRVLLVKQVPIRLAGLAGLVLHQHF